MKQYTVYLKNSGKIVKNIVCSENAIRLNVKQSEAFVEGMFPPESFEIQNGVAVPVADVEDSIEKQWSLIRMMRQSYLQASDWTQLPDVPLATKTAWAEYRQALRDVTLQADPFTIIWPTKPE